MSNGDTVVVFGATGSQGGAVARHLHEAGVRVRAVTRDPSKAAAEALRNLGIEVVKADLDDPATLGPVLQGAQGVFGVFNFWETGYEREIRQGKALMNAARDAGVQHFVYSSVGSADKNTGIVHFESKWQLEQYLTASGLPYTIVRPVFYMNNWYFPMFRDAILKGELRQPLSPDVPLQQVSVDDIGGYVAMIFTHRADWLGRAVDLAGDSLTMPQVAEHFSEVMGRPVRYVPMTLQEFHDLLGSEWSSMYRWFNDVGYSADIAARRREYPRLATFREFLAAHKADWS